MVRWVVCAAVVALLGVGGARPAGAGDVAAAPDCACLENGGHRGVTIDELVAAVENALHGCRHEGRGGGREAYAGIVGDGEGD